MLLVVAFEFALRRLAQTAGPQIAALVGKPDTAVGRLKSFAEDTTLTRTVEKQGVSRR